MTYTISIKDEEGREVWRRYDWQIDSDFQAKGEAIEDMMDTIQPTKVYPDELQVDANQPI